MKTFDLIIIGAGAAGLFAAFSAKRFTKNILILEKNSNAGKKLKLTGGGRCNFTNTANINAFIEAFGENGKFLYPSFLNFFRDDLFNFLNENKIPFVEEEAGRVFLAKHSASDFVNLLVNKLKDINIFYNEIFINISLDKNNIFKIGTNNNIYYSKKVILATGGASYAFTGSDGSAFNIIKKLGHNIVDLKPALVGLESNNLAKLQGLSLNNVNLKILINTKKKIETSGAILFTHYGVSGPIIIDNSEFCVKELLKKNKVSILLDLLKEYNLKDLDSLIIKLLEKHNKKLLINNISSLLPYKTVEFIFDKLSIKQNVTSIDKNKRNELIYLIKNFEIQITGYRGFKEAMLTSGGVDLKEINPKTMESKLLKGFYFAGEVMDIGAKSGGYNLQAAFSTAYLAGETF